MKKKILQLTLIMMFWFTISFITNILGPLIPDIINNFHLSDLAMAGFIPTSFFIAYALMSIPAGILIDRFGEKPVLFCGFLMPFVGTILFAMLHTYPALLASSFIIGLGMAMLQTVINPLQRAVGGEENYAFIAELAQFVFGAASFVSPLVYTYLIHELDPSIYSEGKNWLIDLLARVTPSDLPWVSLYWIFTIILLAMLIAVAVSKFPKIELKEDEKSGSRSSYTELFKRPSVWLFFLGIFCYVSTEQGSSIFMSTFLEQYHGINPQTDGAQTVSLFWGLMTVGCSLRNDSAEVHRQQASASDVGNNHHSIAGMRIVRKQAAFCNGIPCYRIQYFHDVYSIVFSLALNSVSEHHGSFAGILCSAIAGGAIGPLIISSIADHTSLQVGMSALFVFVAYITFIGFWANPIINNKTISLKDLFRQEKSVKYNTYYFIQHEKKYSLFRFIAHICLYRTPTGTNACLTLRRMAQDILSGR